MREKRLYSRPTFIWRSDSILLADKFIVGGENARRSEQARETRPVTREQTGLGTALPAQEEERQRAEEVECARELEPEIQRAEQLLAPSRGVVILTWRGGRRSTPLAAVFLRRAFRQ
jgi:hypothetical protein